MSTRETVVAAQTDSVDVPSTIESEDEVFEIVALLGQGGMGTVYKAYQPSIDRVVALKLINRQLLSEKSIRRLKTEAQACSAVDHPNIVKVFRMCMTPEGQPFLVMEYVRGQTLQERLNNGPLDFDAFGKLFRELLAALDAAHKKNLIHRDIKPSNILLTEDGSCRLMDFGMAKALCPDGSLKEVRATTAGAMVGTPLYMSPEQCEGKPADARSDVYSLGCVMWESLCGKHPFSGGSGLEVMMKHLQAPPPALTIPAPKGISDAISRAMAKKPEDRYASVADLARELDLAAATAIETPSLRQDSRPFSRRLIFTVSSAAIALALLCLFVHYFLDGTKSAAETADSAQATSKQLEALDRRRLQRRGRANRDSESCFDQELIVLQGFFKQLDKSGQQANQSNNSAELAALQKSEMEFIYANLRALDETRIRSFLLDRLHRDGEGLEPRVQETYQKCLTALAPEVYLHAVASKDYADLLERGGDAQEAERWYAESLNNFKHFYRKTHGIINEDTQHHPNIAMPAVRISLARVQLSLERTNEALDNCVRAQHEISRAPAEAAEKAALALECAQLFFNAKDYANARSSYANVISYGNANPNVDPNVLQQAYDGLKKCGLLMQATPTDASH